MNLGNDLKKLFIQINPILDDIYEYSQSNKQDEGINNNI